MPRLVAGAMKVLVADGDAGSLLPAEAAVEQSGHECITAADGDSAWQLYQMHRPQVVVTPLMMPGLDGLSLCRAIRAAGTDSYTYVVLVTSPGSREDVLAGMDAGADDYVSRPLDPFTLHTRLIVALRAISLRADLAGHGTEMAERARTDPLTKLSNRLRLTADLDLLHSRSERYGEDYCLAMCDVDNFKNYNDIYGHSAGDAALKEVATVLARQSRQSDGVYRFGGEEFLLLLPKQSWQGARSALERIRTTVQGLAIAHSGDPSGVLTLSAGISAYMPGHRPGTDQLLKEADEALQMAKAAGRNKVALTDSIARAEAWLASSEARREEGSGFSSHA